MAKDMGTIRPGDVVQVVGLCRMQGRFDARQAGVGNRTRRQPRVPVGIVRRIHTQVFVEDPVLMSSQSIEHGGIALQPYASAQPIPEHGRDKCSILRNPGLALYQGGKRNDLVQTHIRLRHVGRQHLHNFAVKTVEHFLNQRLFRSPQGDEVRIREQITLQTTLGPVEAARKG